MAPAESGGEVVDLWETQRPQARAVRQVPKAASSKNSKKRKKGKDKKQTYSPTPSPDEAREVVISVENDKIDYRPLLRNRFVGHGDRFSHPLTGAFKIDHVDGGNTVTRRTKVTPNRKAPISRGQSLHLDASVDDHLVHISQAPAGSRILLENFHHLPLSLKRRDLSIIDASNQISGAKPMKNIELLRQRHIPSQGPSICDISGLGEVKETLRMAIEQPLKRPERFARFGLRIARGVLLYGPPGCSKTTLARAIAKDYKLPFVSLDCAGVYSPYVGESERQVREAFELCRSISPAILFLDELDAIVCRREMTSAVGGGGSRVSERLLTTLLNEMDGVSELKDVIVVGATNRPDVLDAALLRPGRLDHLIYIPPPDYEARLELIRSCFGRSIEWLARDTECYSGADIVNVYQQSRLMYLNEPILSDEQIREVIQSKGIKGSIQEEHWKIYQAFQDGAR